MLQSVHSIFKEGRMSCEGCLTVMPVSMVHISLRRIFVYLSNV